MKKKILTIIFGAFMIMSLVACNNANSSTNESEVETEESDVEDKEDDEDDSDEDDADEDDADEKDSDENDADDKDDADADDKDNNGDKVYTAEDIAAAFPIDDVKMTVVEDGMETVVGLDGENIFISSEADGEMVEIYFVGTVMYMHVKSAGDDMWMKTENQEDTIQQMYDELNLLDVEASMNDVEYIETVEENGNTFDVVQLTEIRDGEEYQTLLFYINVDTGLTEKTVNEEDGIVIYYEPYDGFVLPAEAENALEM